MADILPRVSSTPPRLSVWRLLVRTFSHFVSDDAPMMAGHLTFMALLSLFPFLIFLVALAGFVGQTEAGNQAIELMLTAMPPAIRQVFETPIREVVRNASGGLLTVGIVGSLWTASSGLEAARTALNYAYETYVDRSIWRTRLESIVIVVTTAVLLIAAMAVLVLGPLVWRALAERFDFPDGTELLWNVIRYVFGAVLIFLTVTGLYSTLTTARLKWRWVLPGSLLVLVLWLVAATLFSQFLKFAPDYTITYGSLAGIVLAMLFIYVLALIFLFGAQLNATLARHEGGLPARRPRRQA